MGRRQRSRTFVRKLPQLMLTLEQLTFLRQAVIVLEHMLLKHKEPHPNAEFALTTVTKVQTKIGRMIAQGARGTGVGLDANDILLLRSAVSLFAAALEELEPSAESEALKKQCQTLTVLLARPSSSRFV